jgi:hypothetical protein
MQLQNNKIRVKYAFHLLNLNQLYHFEKNKLNF